MDVATLIPQGCFPSTRYQGSKRRLVPQILEHVRGLEFATALDAFGGTGAVAHALKCMGKRVTYNDFLRFNHQIGVALIENDRVQLTDADVAGVGKRCRSVEYADFIERTFAGIYFTDEENRWLDVAVGNIRALPCRFKRALCWFALCQSALAKRPYNLFHRKNLYMRTAAVARSFGNKATWDRPFPEHFRTFARAANEAVVDSGGKCGAICRDVLEAPQDHDLVYLDPPYVDGRGVGVDYHHFYHFLEGMVNYETWPEVIDASSKHRRLSPRKTPWNDKESFLGWLGEIFCRFRRSIIVLSYRSDGTPSVQDFLDLLRAVKPNVQAHELARYQYALSTNVQSHEVLFVAA
jgi:adenine-specific DNA methylase